MTKQEAEKYAEQTALRLNKKLGGKWQTDVWNNLGWCCRVHLGSISVSISENLRYDNSLRFSAYVSTKIGGVGALTFWSDDKNYGRKTPEEAVKNALKYAQKEVTNLQNVLLNNYKLMPVVYNKIEEFKKLKHG